MGKIKGWDKTHERKDMILWQNGGKPANPLHMRTNFIRVEKTTQYIEREFGVYWRVDSSDRINTKTVQGKVINFKTKKRAIAFAMRYMKLHPNG